MIAFGAGIVFFTLPVASLAFFSLHSKAKVKIRRIHAKSKMSRPVKIVWPIGFERMLLYAIPDVRNEDRFRFYRLFLRDNLHRPSSYKASPEEIETAFLADRKKQFDENTAFHIRMWMGLAMPQWRLENLKNRAQTAAKARWKKQQGKNRKKN